MKIVSTIFAGTALVVASGAMAQDPAPMAEAGAETSAEASAETAFTDGEIASFAAAAIKIQALEGDAATKQQNAAQIVAQSDLDAETFNAINAAMQSDPEVAKRVQLAAAALQEQPAG